MKPTRQQSDIYEASLSIRSGDALKIIAGAGSGKTTTLKGIAGIKSERGVYLSFNRANADEAKVKLARTRCTAMSMHGLAFRTMADMIGSPARHNARSVISSGAMDRVHIPDIKGWKGYRIGAAAVRTMSEFAASADDDFDISHARAAILSSVGDPERIKDREKREAARQALDYLATPVLAIARDFWLREVEKGNYSHDMYLKTLDLDDGLREAAFGRFRYAMVDEAQDMNPVQRSILTKCGLPLIAVGDPYQQIYSWRGAENALALMPGREMHLTQSFRFGENIAEQARRVLESRPDGGPDYRIEGAGPGAMPDSPTKLAVICRTNVGMIDEALRAMSRNIPIHVDNFDGMVSDVRSAQAIFEGRPDDVTSNDMKHFSDWDEVKTEAEEGDPTMVRMVKIVEGKMVPQIESIDQKRVGADKARMAICTGHRSKGMEFPGVKLGEDWADVGALSRRHAKAAAKSSREETLAMEEFNTLYVAVTRAMVKLAGHESILYPKMPEAEAGDDMVIDGRDDEYMPMDAIDEARREGWVTSREQGNSRKNSPDVSNMDPEFG